MLGVSMFTRPVRLSIAVAIASALTLSSCSSQTPTPTPASADSCERVVTASLSAYELWITQGNTGSLEDFFDALVGEKGAEAYVGADGANGAPGAPGETGNQGNPGPSAYQLWLDLGNVGTPTQFLNSIAGADGLDGLNGLSAYELWLTVGNTGTTQDFLDSLVGATGQQGIPGICTTGDIGPQGPAGPIGPSGSPGPTGATGAVGATGAQGPAGVSPVLYYGSFYDTSDQANNPVNTARAMTLNQVTNGVNGVIADGVNVVSGSRITVANPGVYNLQFSAQLYNGSGAASVDIWLAKNGQSVSQTNTQEYIPANNRVVAAWNFVVSAQSGDYFEFMWLSSDTNTVINSVASRTVNGYTIPAIPGLIVTVTQAR